MILSMAMFLCFVLGLVIFIFLGGITVFWLLPNLVWRELRKNRFNGPPPLFPLGNLMEMSKKYEDSSNFSLSSMKHDIHSSVFPFFARWRKLYGKVFIYWLGTEPFLYVAEPEFLKQITSGLLSKKWGKPDVFKYDRKPMFGQGLVMVEGDAWTNHRNIISPAFSATNLNNMINLMEESTNQMLDKWSNQVSSGQHEIDILEDVIRNAAEIIAKTSFGISEEKGKQVFEMLQLMQTMLFNTNRLVGVPFSKYMNAKQTYEAYKLGKDIDKLLLEMIKTRREGGGNGRQTDLLGLLIASNEEKRRLTSGELVDECKTFFFGGHETTALAISWTLLLLALHPEWQRELREEIVEVSGSGPFDFENLSKLTKMGWVWNEVLRLYSPAPNAQRQAREDIKVGNDIVIPKGTNMWVDIVGMHHDPKLWGEDVNEFKPQRFKEDMFGGCKHRMGYLPFGFSGRICVGRNLSSMEFKVVLSLILTNFSLSISPTYSHLPRYMLSMRPSHGVQLILHRVDEAN